MNQFCLSCASHGVSKLVALAGARITLSSLAAQPPSDHLRQQRTPRFANLRVKKLALSLTLQLRSTGCLRSTWTSCSTTFLATRRKIAVFIPAHLPKHQKASHEPSQADKRYQHFPTGKSRHCFRLCRRITLLAERPPYSSTELFFGAEPRPRPLLLWAACPWLIT